MSGESWLGVLCAVAETLRGGVAVCSAETMQQAGVRGAETAAVTKPEERAVPGRNIPPGCPVPHALASFFCSETMFSPKESNREFRSILSVNPIGPP